MCEKTPMKINFKNKPLLLIIGVIFGCACSCSIYQPAPLNSPEGKIPGTFSQHSDNSPSRQCFWKELNEPELNSLIDEAFSGNFTLKQAWARLKQARASAVIAGANLYPSLTFSADGSRARQRTDTGRAADSKTASNYSLALASSYELDLWGRVRAGEQSASLEFEATREDLSTAAMTLAAEVTEHWANIISKKMQKILLEKQLKTSLTYLELVELRYRNSMASALAVYQQTQVVEKVRAQIPLVESQEQAFLYELALLIGKPPGTVLQINRETIPDLPGIPGTGLPANLLSARPDIRAARKRLQAAGWQVSAAQADRLPAISLNASGAFGAGKMDLLFDNWLLSLAANLTAPLFDGDRREAEVDRTRAIVDEVLAAYRKTVYTAIKEVENALVGEKNLAIHIKALERETTAARRALEEARERYLKGIDSYLAVLTQLLTLQQLEQDMIERKTERFIQRIRLYRALGGTWTKNLAPATGLNTYEAK